jgi:hypothetical protein
MAQFKCYVPVLLAQFAQHCLNFCHWLRIIFSTKKSPRLSGGVFSVHTTNSAAALTGILIAQKNSPSSGLSCLIDPAILSLDDLTWFSNLFPPWQFL